MKRIKFFMLAVVSATVISCNSNQIANNKTLNNEIDSISYALGMDMANKFKENLPQVNSGVFMQGYTNGMDSVNLLIKAADLENVIQTYFQKDQKRKMLEAQAKQLKEVEAKFGHIKKEGEAFLAENKTKEGVVTTLSGLQYIVIKEGKGKKPEADSKVKVHYHGTLLDGTVFDSSVEKGTPIEMFVNEFIQGWVEGLQLMPTGSKYKFFIPQELAYGAFPRAGVIKPFMALIFEIELLEVKNY